MKFSIIYLFLFLFGIIYFGILHEQVHVAIMENYGIDSHIEYFSHFPDFVTIYEKPCPTEECVKLNIQNEIIGYHAQMFYFLVGFGLFFIIFILEEIYNETRRKS